MHKQLEQLLRLKDGMNEVFADIEKTYYPMRDGLSESKPFSTQYNNNIKKEAQKVKEVIKTLPNCQFRQNIEDELRSCELYVDFMKDRKSLPNNLTITGFGHYHFQAVKPLLKSITQQLCEYFSDYTVELRSAADIAFEHLQKSIIVNKVPKEEWGSTWDDKKLETRFEKLGDSHLLSHKIWSAKFYTEQASTDLVLSDPTFETQIDPTDGKYQTGKGLLLTEWKVCRDKHVEKLIEKAILQVKKYRSPHLSGFEFARLCYIVIVSEDYVDIGMVDRLIDGITLRIINIACKPSSPSRVAKKS